MKIKKIILFFLTTLFLSTISFSYFVEKNNGENFYFINKVNPQINISIQNANENSTIRSITLDDEIILIDEDLTYFDIFNRKIDLNDFSNFSGLNKSYSPYLRLNVVNSENDSVQTSGDPKYFSIKFDNSSLNLLTQIPILQTTNLNRVSLEFNRKIKSIKIYDTANNLLIDNDYKFINSPIIFSPINSRLNLQNTDTHNFKIIVEDFYENKLEKDISISISGTEKFKVNLITRKEERDLSYFYDRNIDIKYPEFFDGKIYSKENVFLFKIKTNKPANCYYSIRDTPISFNMNTVKKLLNSSENRRTHFREMRIISDSTYWFECITDNYEIEKIEEFDTNILTFEQFNEMGDFEILRYVPRDFQTSINFNFIIQTNHISVCEKNIYQVYNEGTNPINKYVYFSEAEKLHLDLSNIGSQGNFSYNAKCFNKVYDLDNFSSYFLIDENLGLHIVAESYNEYRDVQGDRIEFRLSEPVRNCKYISTIDEKYNEIITQSNIYDSLTRVLENGSTNQHKRIILNFLERGENLFSIYCEDIHGNINSNSAGLRIIYDPTNPNIGDLNFVQNGIKINKISPNRALDVNFNYTNFIPYDKLHIQILRDDLIIKNITKSVGEIFQDDNENLPVLSKNQVRKNLQTGDLIKISVETVLGKNSSFSEKIIILQEKLILSSSINGGKLYLSCGENHSNIKYGFNDLKDKCLATLLYNNENPPIISKNLFYCAAKITGDMEDNCDYIVRETGLNQTPQTEFNTTFQNEDVPIPEVEPEDTTKINPDDNSNVDDIINPDKKSSSGILITSLIIFFIIMISVGVLAYLYHRGKLDDFVDKHFPKYSKNKKFIQKNVTGKILENKFIPQKTFFNKKEHKKRKSYLNNIFKRKKIFDEFKKEEENNDADTFEEYLKNKKKEGNEK